MSITIIFKDGSQLYESKTVQQVFTVIHKSEADRLYLHIWSKGGHTLQIAMDRIEAFTIEK